MSFWDYIVALGNAIGVIVMGTAGVLVYFFGHNFELAVILLLLSLACGQSLAIHHIKEAQR